MMTTVNKKTHSIYSMMKLVKEAMIMKELIKIAIREAMQMWKMAELEEIIRKPWKMKCERELSNLSNEQATIKRMYSGAVKEQNESVVGIKPGDKKLNSTEE